MIIHGNYAGFMTAKPDWNQTDPARADYIRGRDDLEVLIGGKQPKHRTATATLTSAGWAGNAQTVSCEGVTEGNALIVAAAPENYEAYAKAGIYCSAQAEGSLTFTCKSAPDGDLTANIMILD